MTARARWFVVGVALASLLAAACGVSENSGPELIARENVPHGLLDPSPSSSTTTPGPTREVMVFLAETSGRETRLREATREAQAPLTVRSVLEALLEPLSEDERDDGYSTFLVPEQAAVNDVTIGENGTVVVDVGQGTLSLRDKGGRFAFAQIVFTLTELPEVDALLFRIDGEPINAITGDGAESTEPVNRADYRELAPS